MVTKQTVEENVYSEIQTSISSNSDISDDDIYLRGDDSTEIRPRVVYDTTPTVMEYNNASDGVYAYVTNADDDVIAEVKREYITLTFDIQVLDDRQSIVNGIYEDIRSHFLKYSERILDYEDIDDEISNLDVGTSSREPSFGTEPTSLYEFLPVDVEFYRKVTQDGTPIRRIQQDVDGKTKVIGTKN